MVNWSMRWRISPSSPCAPVVRTFSYVGPVSMLLVIPGSLWRTLRAVRMLFVLLRRLAGWFYPAPRRLRLRKHAAKLRLPFALPGMQWTRALVISTQPWWAGAFCTGGPVVAGPSDGSKPRRSTVARTFRLRLYAAHTRQASALRGGHAAGRGFTGNSRFCFRRLHLRESSEPPGGTAS